VTLVFAVTMYNTRPQTRSIVVADTVAMLQAAISHKSQIARVITQKPSVPTCTTLS